MKASELRELTREELGAKETELTEQLFALRLQKVTGQLENPAKMRNVRKDRARVLTVLGEKSRAREVTQ
ncbi:MAG: 50S ribosomal protein L29 [Thermoanaerobaculia bacterium]